MPSTDGVTRGKIAALPPELSEVERVDEMCTDSDIARAMQAKAKAALELLYDYNEKLDKELDDRKLASMKLQDFLYAQKDLLTQAEQRLEVSLIYSSLVNLLWCRLQFHWPVFRSIKVM